MRELKSVTEGMKDLILNNWHEHIVEVDKLHQSGQREWMDKIMEGHYYGPIPFYDWNNPSKSRAKFYFQNKDDKALFELTWG